MAAKTVEKLKENINPKCNPWTTILGVIFLIIGLFLVIGNAILDFKRQPEWYWPAGFIGAGVGLLLMKDKMLFAFDAGIDFLIAEYLTKKNKDETE